VIKYLRSHLGVKLFLSYLAVIMIGAGILFFATTLALPTAFERHLGISEQDVEHSDATSSGSGPGSGSGSRFGESSGYGKELFENFKASFNEALVYSGIAALAAGFLASWFFSRGIIAPVRAMMHASHRIAEGKYEERVDKERSDELGQLARSFNQMAEKLEEVEIMRRQLIGDVSHELRTPLTAIKGSMEGLMDGILPAEAETYQQIHQEAGRLGRLVDDLQELSRVEAGAYPMQVRPVDLANLVDTMIKRFSLQFDAKRVALIPNLPAKLPHLLADEDRVIQILTNLLGNALRHTSADGSVILSAKEHGEFVHLSVKDTGVGIPPEHLENIFTRFYRVDKSRSRQQGGGSGIGLTVAKHLVEAHGGAIWVESEGKGRGTTFGFSLPTV
jgi:signal transduction histidine kinase